MHTLWQDIRYGMHMLLKSPSFTLVAVVALALGIGANTAIFSVVNAVLLRPLPYKNPERLVMMWQTNLRQGIGQDSVAAPNFLDWREQSQSFEHMAAYRGQSFNLTVGDKPEQLPGAVVSASFFQVLGVKAALGRLPQTEVDQPGGNLVAVLSHGLWQRHFGADPNLIGKPLTLNGESFTAVGIMPPGFKYPLDDTEVWALSKRAVPELPITIPGIDDPLTLRGATYLKVIARLKPGVSLTQAQAEMATVSHRLEQYEDNEGVGVKIIPLQEQLVGDSRLVLLVLLGVVGFVLAVACANVANLLLARAAVRQKEIAIRHALGASRWRLARQLLTESVLLSVIGGVLGLVLAWWGIDLLMASIPEEIPRVKEVSLDPYVLGFTFAVSVLTGVLFGLAPALGASKPDLNSVLKEGGRTSTESIRRNRVRSLLVVSEVALALVLLVGAGLMMQSFLRLSEVNPGFNPENLVTAGLWLPQFKYPEDAQQVAFYTKLLERVAQLPGVSSSAAISVLPLTGSNVSTSPRVEGRPEPDEGERSEVQLRSVSPGYFRTMGIPLLQGRDFSTRDDEDAQGVVVISEAGARRLFGSKDAAMGERLDYVGDMEIHSWSEIVGVVGDVHESGLDQEATAEVYAPYRQLPSAFMSVVTRSALDPTNLTNAIRREVQAIDKDQPILEARTMNERIAESIAARRFSMQLFAVFAGIALVLAVVGIYGVMSYTVARRTHEIGIRMALGAGRGDVLHMVVGQGMILAAVGISIGVIAAFALTRVISSMLYGVSATDPVTFVGVAMLLTIVALVACYIPARRATKVDPMVALRY